MYKPKGHEIRKSDFIELHDFLGTEFISHSKIELLNFDAKIIEMENMFGRSCYIASLVSSCLTVYMLECKFKSFNDLSIGRPCSHLSQKSIQYIELCCNRFSFANFNPNIDFDLVTNLKMFSFIFR